VEIGKCENVEMIGNHKIEDWREQSDGSIETGKRGNERRRGGEDEETRGLGDLGTGRRGDDGKMTECLVLK